MVYWSINLGNDLVLVLTVHCVIDSFFGSESLESFWSTMTLTVQYSNDVGSSVTFVDRGV